MHRTQDYRLALPALGRLLSYPSEAYLQDVEFLYVLLQSALQDAAKAMAAFGAHVERCDTWELEELYTRTFDINPQCALEVGWHLFGEDYARGTLLVRLRGELRDRGLRESAELPDHIVHVLAVVAAMEPWEGQRLVHACVLPAATKMHAALQKASSPYRHVIDCLLIVLHYSFGKPAATADQAGGGEAISGGMPGDPLQSFPRPCSSTGAVELVPLQMHFGRSGPTPCEAGRTDTSQGNT